MDLLFDRRKMRHAAEYSTPTLYLLLDFFLTLTEHLEALKEYIHD